MSLINKLKKNSTLDHTDLLADSKFFAEKDMIQTPIPAMNIALSGSISGGLTPGLTVFAGPSKHFKTAFMLLLMKSYLDKYEDGAVLFYDNEFGANQEYFNSFGIDMERVLHIPITNVEELKNDMMNQLKDIERGDRVFIAVDSIGNLASIKEVEDAIEGKQVADMTRAKQLKSLGRMITPHFTLKDIPCVMVNHTYKEIGLFPKDIMSGGTGIYYSADSIYIVGRRQEKNGSDIAGYNFILNVEKSRFVKEKSKIPIEVTWGDGINKFSGLLEIAMHLGFVTKPKNGWYQKEGTEKMMRLKDTNNEEFWADILNNPEFQNKVKELYVVGSGNSIFDFEDEDGNIV